jgi:hypothetical protein
MSAKRQKSGASARIGLFLALAQYLDQARFDRAFAARKKYGRGRSSGRGRPQKSRPAGFKLVKKMARRPYCPPLPTNLRKLHKYIERGYGFTAPIGAAGGER